MKKRISSTVRVDESHHSWLSPSKVSIEDYVLVVVRGPHAGMELPLSDEIVLIGRGSWCDVVLEQDSSVSTEHCEIRISEQRILLRDLQSSNGVYFGDARVVEIFMHPGMQIQVGKSVFELRSRSKRKEIEVKYHDDSNLLFGRSSKMRKIFSLLSRLGQQEISVLLKGETGTGKSTIAKALNQHSKRKEAPFIVVNCGAISHSLVESLFFGYEKGAFTGSEKRHRGYFEQAHGGTLFLDEIGDLPLELQPKLLDVLERKKIKRLGSEQEIDVDFWLISATHADLAEAVRQNRFREDLYYRLAVVELEVPALRDRPEDIPLLVNAFLAELQLYQHLVLTPAALHKLQSYFWPGNVRQLYNVLRRSIALLEREGNIYEGIRALDAHEVDLPSTEPFAESAFAEIPSFHENSSENLPAIAPDFQTFSTGLLSEGKALKEMVEAFEKSLIEASLEECGWKIQATADRLQITRVWLYKRMKKYQIKNPSHS